MSIADRVSMEAEEIDFHGVRLAHYPATGSVTMQVISEPVREPDPRSTPMLMDALREMLSTSVEVEKIVLVKNQTHDAEVHFDRSYADGRVRAATLSRQMAGQGFRVEMARTRRSFWRSDYYLKVTDWDRAPTAVNSDRVGAEEPVISSVSNATATGLRTAIAQILIGVRGFRSVTLDGQDGSQASVSFLSPDSYDREYVLKTAELLIENGIYAEVRPVVGYGSFGLSDRDPTYYLRVHDERGNA